jgi:hypothetical protein
MIAWSYGAACAVHLPRFFLCMIFMPFLSCDSHFLCIRSTIKSFSTKQSLSFSNKIHLLRPRRSSQILCSRRKHRLQLLHLLSMCSMEAHTLDFRQLPISQWPARHTNICIQSQFHSTRASSLLLLLLPRRRHCHSTPRGCPSIPRSRRRRRRLLLRARRST